ncbi:hypothetical protein [Cellulosilyticum ruminicola]|uniref:hypothetical protein n=1 Tax=Cellulosilyticum ruminicola TaxID=425254 RepID=UPI0006D1AE7F|nr:hypothetical protein [Cellulosilyticum ruminicola]
MIRIITGNPGEGKTKLLIDKANETVKHLTGHAVYIDSCCSHRLALSHHIRLVETCPFKLDNTQHFFGFLCGLLASNHDIQVVFIDELLKITHASIDELIVIVDEMKRLSNEFNVDFIIGASCSNKDLPSQMAPYLIA